jgi:hypothetical protein
VVHRKVTNREKEEVLRLFGMRQVKDESGAEKLSLSICGPNLGRRVTLLKSPSLFYRVTRRMISVTVTLRSKDES